MKGRACDGLQFADYIYLAAYSILKSSSLKLLKTGEVESVKINIEGTDPIIASILLDKNNALWIMLDDGSLCIMWKKDRLMR